MNCPKCNSPLEDNASVCPNCKKVLTLVCPRCGAHNDTSDCAVCGFSILSKCSSCGLLNKTEDKICRKCGTSTLESAAKRFTNMESFASLTISFGNLNKLGQTLGSNSLLSKFIFKIKTLVFNFSKDEGAHPIKINDSTYILNFIKDNSEYLSAQNAVKSGIKLLNIICNLNRSLKKELMFSLEARISVEQKNLIEFFDVVVCSDKIKLLDLYTEQKSDSKGLQFTADESIYKFLNKEYNMESLYSTEKEGKVISYYAFNVADYLIPAKKEDDSVDTASLSKVKVVTKKEVDYEQELYKKSIEGIRVNCKFEQLGADKVLEFLKGMNFQSGNRIVSLRGSADRQLPTKYILDLIPDNVPCSTIVCSNSVGRTSWKFFAALLDSIQNSLPSVGVKNLELFEALKANTPPVFDSAEDARLAYVAAFTELMFSLPRRVIYIENFEYIDSASLGVLEEVFSKIERTNLSFVITNEKTYALQKQIPCLLNSPYYHEIFLGEPNLANVAKQILDSEDFRNSFYYKKILDNAGSSYQYCIQAINYLIDAGVVVNFNGKVVLTDSKTTIIPFGLEALINARLKKMSSDAGVSLILAYSFLLGPVIHNSVLEKLGLYNREKISILENMGFVVSLGDRILVQNFEILQKSFKTTLKPEVLKYLSTNLLTKVFTGSVKDYVVVTALEYLENTSLEFSKLYELSILTLQFGDYDSYLKMCIRLLELLKLLSKEVSEDEIQEYQTDFYNNLTQLLYRYAPEKIYPIAESLLQTALQRNDSAKIKTLSNMMLQGGLLTSNYTNALLLIQNVLERTENCVLVNENNVINYRVFALYLVSVEIYFYLGYYDKCISVCEDLLKVLTPERIIEVKPAIFSELQFKAHLSESFIYYALSLLLVGDADISEIIQNLETSLGFTPEGVFELIELNKVLSGGVPQVLIEDGTEGLSVLLAKFVNAMTSFTGDYSVFASKIFEFKKLADSQSKYPFVLFGDLMIAYSYKSMGAYGKAEHIYNNVFSKAKQNSLFFLVHLAAYFIADLCSERGDAQMALQTITNSIIVLERLATPPLFLLYIMKKKLVEIVKFQGYVNTDISAEEGFIVQMESKYVGLSKLMHV